MNATSLRTSAFLALVAAFAVSGIGLAQSAPPATGTQAAQQAQRQDPKTGAPVPAVEPRFEKTEKPAPARRPADVRGQEGLQRAIEELEQTAPEFERVRFRPVFRMGQDYSLKAGDRVREVIGIMANVRIDGEVDGDAVVVAGSATLGSTAIIRGSLVIVGGPATIEPGAQVHRDLVVVGGAVTAPPDFLPRGEHVVIGTPIIGDSIRNLFPWFTRGLLWGRLIVPDLRWIWGVVLVMFLVGVVLNHVFDRQVAACADTLAQKPLTAFLMGLLVLMISGPILIILAASIIGLAVVPFAAVALVAAKIIGKIGVTRAMGRSILAEDEAGNRAQGLRSYVLGSAIVILAYMVPVAGILTYLLIGTFGLGSATLAFVSRLRKERPAPPVTPAPQPPAGPSGPVPGAPVEPMGSPMQSPGYGAPSASAFVAVEPPVVAAAPAEQAAPSWAPPVAEPAAPPPYTLPGARVGAGPAPAGASGDLLLYPRASFFDRVAAVVLDLLLIAIANSLLDLFWRDGGFVLLVLAYHVAFWAWKGTTLGGIICNVRMVRTTGGDPRFVDALVRGLSAIFSVVALGIGVLWMLNDAERQMWHDKIAGTVVVKLPRELVLA